MADEEKDTKMSRRRFIRNSSYVAGGAIGGGLLGSFFGPNLLDKNQQPSTKSTQEAGFDRALMYFTRHSDFNILSAASERIFPEDENGPGAIELGVPYFIDHQLASGYGMNEKEYMQGPFFPGSDYQGYQTALKRHEVFMAGIRALEEESQSDYDTSFVDLDGEQQDEILQKFESNKIEMKGLTSATFFETLRSATLNGVYADPLYNGNDNMEGWKMKQFPGSQMAYINELEEEEFIEMEPKALKDHL